MTGIVAGLRLGEAPPEQLRLVSVLGSWPFATTASEILAFRHGSGDPSGYSLPPGAAAGIGRAFHAMAGTLTPRVRQTLDAMRVGRQWLRVAHQPNFAAYLKVVALFIAAEEASLLTDTVPTYVMNDCDVITNKRFCRVILPDVTHPRGGRYLSVRDPGMPSSQVMFRAARPPVGWLQSTIQLIRDNSRQEESLLQHPRPGVRISVDDIVSDVEFAWHNSATLSEMTGILLSRVANLRLGLGTIFLPGHTLWMSAGTGISTAILGRWPEIARAQKRVASALEEAGLDLNLSWLTEESLAPLWWVCSCGCRVRLDLETAAGPLRGTCGQCRRKALISVCDVASRTAGGQLMPRVGALDLAENLAGEMRAGVTYTSSAAHSLAAALVARELEIGALPQVFIDIRGFFGTPLEMTTGSAALLRQAVGLDRAKAWIAEGRASSVYYLTRAPVPALAASIRDWIRSGALDDPLEVS
jgi:hypothetical protein